MQTNNYNIFSFRKDNREIKSQKVKRFELDIEKYGYIKYLPILVDSNFIIMDGQHRYLACKNLDLPIFYEIIENSSQELMISLNRNQQSWEVIDYIHSASQNNIKCYIDFLEFKEKYKLNVSTAIILFFGHGKSKQIKNQTELKPKENREFVINIIKKFVHLKYKFDKGFVLAIQSIVDKGVEIKNLNYLIEKQLLFSKMASVEQYITMFENILNNRRGKSLKVSLK